MGNERLWRDYKPTARGIEEHEITLGLDVEELKDKKILDIGSGLNQLANELKEKGHDLDIVSIDPFYALTRDEKEGVYDGNYEDGSEELSKLLDKLEPQERSSSLVAGRSENLPFSDCTFDFIISHFGSPFYAETADEIKSSFSEIIRVLRAGGEARMFPSWLKYSTTELDNALQDVMSSLQEGGVDIARVGNIWQIRKPLD